MYRKQWYWKHMTQPKLYSEQKSMALSAFNFKEENENKEKLTYFKR